MARRRHGWSWRAKLALLLAIFALIPLMFATYFSIREQGLFVRRQTLASLEALVRAKAEAIDQFADFRRRDAERMATLLAPFVVSLEEAKQQHRVVEETPAEELPQLEDAEESPDTAEEETAGEDGEAPADEPDMGPDEVEPDPEAQQTEPEPEAEPEPESEAEPDKDDAQEAEPTAVLEARQALRRAVGLIAWDLEEFEEILVMDPEGRVIVSTFEKHEGTAGKSLRYFQKGLNATFLEPVFLSPITGELTMVIATPIHDSARKPIGVLAARLNLTRFFRLINDSTGLGETGETVAGRVEKDDVVLMAPTRHDPDGALQTKIALGEPSSRGLQEAARGQVGSGVGTDYRGEQVLAAWRHVPSLDWGLVIKMDEAEALAPVDQAARTAAAGGAVLVVGALLGALFVSRLFVRPLRDLQEATERISRGDFEVSLDIRSNDEIGELADSFDRMVAAIKFFREHSRAEDEDLEPEEIPKRPATEREDQSESSEPGESR